MAAPTWLIPIDGPPLSPLELKGPAQGITVGRSEQCNVCMPPTAEGVSRNHARLRLDGTQWMLADLNSSWGTFVNGTKLPPDTEFPLAEGDLIRIGVWTLKLGSQPERRVLRSQDDLGQSIIAQPAGPTLRPLTENLLTLLLNGATTIHASKTEAELAGRLVELAQSGTGLKHAFILRPIDAAGGIEIVATSSMGSGAGIADDGAPQQFSRSLIAAAAARGGVAELCKNDSEEYGNSIAQLNITCAICVPLMLGESPAAFLYMDSRGGKAKSLPAQSSAFCTALGTMGSLALANLKRIDLEKRETAARAELTAAAAAQQWILPKRTGRYGRFNTLGESRPGQFVGGDFFDLIELGDGRLAVSLGDVAGKGVSASVLMTAAQGYLHSAITQHGEPGRAVSELNEFIIPRRPEHRFITMWVGVFDAERGTIQYVDAGHGYAVRKRGAVFTKLDQGAGLPIGVASQKYLAETVDLASGDELIVVSDGVVEQSSSTEKRDEFGMSGVCQSLATSGANDPIAALFDALIRHAGTHRLADDATAVMIRC
jgi:serine phosphatase RsbU (regulator of sigma subunit)